MDLNTEQKKIAFQEPRGHALIKGVAGSGKTSVGIYRINYLLNNYCFAKDDRILVATYNRTLIAYMAHLYEKIENREFDEFQSLFRADAGKVDIQTVDSLMYPYFQAYLQESGLALKLGGHKGLDYEIVSEGVAKLKKQYPKVAVLDQKNTSFLLEEIGWIKDCLYLEEEEYQSADRVGKARTGAKNLPQRLPKNSETRKAIFELMQYFDRELRARKYVSFNQMRVWAIEQARKQVREKYTHIILDESQDLTRSQLLFLKSLHNYDKDYSSFFFIADNAQSIYAQSWLGSGRSFASIGYDMTGRSRELSKNFRTTTQISKAAYSLIEACPEIVEDEYFVKPALIDKQGQYPVLKVFDGENAALDFLCREIKSLRQTEPDKEIAVIARLKNQINRLHKHLTASGVPCALFGDDETGFGTEPVKLITMHSIKGLEFPQVFIFGLDEKVMPWIRSADPERRAEQEVRERRLLYVGMTRATEALCLLSGSGKPSRFLGDIDPKLLRIDRECKLRRFYNVPIDDYRFKEKVADIYSQEEKVRQWVLAELVETYGYPLSNLAAEYGLNAFSQKGFVDVAMLIREEGRMLPLAFIETKRPGHSLEGAMRQLQSYMSHCRPCRYGAVTDGQQFVVVDSDFKPVSDLPAFRPTWQSSSLRRYGYRNLKTGRDYLLAVDENDPSSLEIQNPNGTELIEKDDLATLPVYGKIAAGRPLTMNPELDDRFYFPRTWHRGADHFILKVRGDSMQEAGIHESDFVVVRQQETAENRDIAVVAIDEEATLKRFSRMGSTIILLSENPKYDPIMLEDSQVAVLGVAVGVINNV
jgi:SOS regulatory protein LexA